jgi:hypothetical protein
MESKPTNQNDAPALETPPPKTSWRPESFAQKHSVSTSFIYGEIREGRLRVHKPAPGITIITEQDEIAWLAAMPTKLAPAPKVTRHRRPTTNSAAITAE